MPMHQAFLSFNSGELSPYLQYRNDFVKYPAGAERMRNFLPLPFGAVSKRPGTVWLRKALGTGLNNRAFPFTASDGTDYVLHFTPGVLTIYRMDGTTADTLAFIPGFTWPAFGWDSSIRALQMVQVNDVAFFAHPLIHPLRLRSLADTEWALEFVPFVEAPMLDENLDADRLLTVASNPIAAAWSNGANYGAGQTVFYELAEWTASKAHTATLARAPGAGDDWREYWSRKFYKAGDAITITAKDKAGPDAWDLRFRNFSPDYVGWYKPSGSFVEDTDSMTICQIGHTMDASYLGSGFYAHEQRNFSNPVPVVEWCEVFAWAHGEGTSSGWANGEMCYLDGKLYLCSADHADDGNTARRPGSGADWADYWDEYGEVPDPLPRIVVSGTYEVGDKATKAGHVYTCILAHTPNAPVNEPGSGSAWETYWVESSIFLPSFAISSRSPGTYWRLAPERDGRDFQVEIRATEGNDGKFSDHIAVDGGWNLFTYGTWTGTFLIERSTNGGTTWETIRTYQGSADRNVVDSGTEDQPVLLRLGFKKEDGTGGSGKQRAVLIPQNASVTGYALMTEYVDADEMRGVANTSMISGSTFHWSEGAFDEARGFPRALTLHGFRLWLAGTTRNPISLWGSRINDFTDFEETTEDDAGMFRTLASSNSKPIRWLASTRRLFLGTNAGEWVEGSETTDVPITPTNIQLREYTPYGSCPHQPLKVNDTVFFLGRQGGRLYELASAPANDTFQAADLSRLADHLTAPGISNFAFQQTREPCLWAVTRPGNLLSFHYSRDESLAAWAMHTTLNGQFRDVMQFRSDSGDDHIVFMIERPDGIHLERFPQGWQATQERGEVGTYVDAAGKTTGGNLAIGAELRVPPQDLQLDGGTSHGRKKRANEILLNLYQSFRGGVDYDGTLLKFDYSFSSDPMDVALPSFTGWKSLTLTPAHMDDLQFSIVHTEPFPFTVRAVVLRWEITEP